MKQADSEIQFSSSVAKLLHHIHRLRYPLRPITLQLALTDKCNLNCDFCSVKNRAGDELDEEQIIHVLTHPKFSLLHGVEITGAGEPTLYPGINDLIHYIVTSRYLKVGLITNGVALMEKLSIETMGLLTWMRVSLNGLDYVDEIRLTTRIPGEIALGFSYILNDRTTQGTLDKVAEYAERLGAEYVRIVPDCLDLDKDYTHLKLDYPGFYVQTKAMGPLAPEAPCRMGYLKPYLNADGFFYWCSGLCLEERRFPPKYRMGRWDDITGIWGSQTPFACDFSKCFWVEQNKILEYINMPIQHEAFI